MKATWNPHVSLRFVCVRRRLGLKDTEFGSGASLLVPLLLPPRSTRPRWPSQAAGLSEATVLLSGLLLATAWSARSRGLFLVVSLVLAKS